MSTLYLLRRYIQVKNTFLKLHGGVLQKVQASSSSSDEDKFQKKREIKKKNEDALNKLNTLLKTMIEEDTTMSKTKLNLAKPSNKRQNNVKKEVETESTKKSSETQMLNAIKDVALSLEGDAKQIESELLMKLLNTTNRNKESTITNLTDLVKGMKIDHEVSVSNEQSKAQQVRQILHAKTGQFKRPKTIRGTKTQLIFEKIDLFGTEPLGIFTKIQNNGGVKNLIWDKLHERDLKLAVTHPPKNYFEQMILWTEQQKVWKFPIDNEQDLQEEKKVPFTEHVFLDKYLEPWCPTKGPLRHFMELVCVGLSKNPYLTVEAKREHIEWFKNYFEDKKQLLQEVGAIQDQNQQNSKQIE
jgi:small subunit ribosomal protein S31